MALSLDGNAHAIATGGTTCAVTLTTTLTNDIIVVLAVGEANAGRSVSGIADVAGLTWARRKQYQFSIANPGGYIEVWWALAPSALSADVITVTFAGTIDDAGVVAFGVNGADTTTPWDVNAAIPAPAANAGAGTPSVGSVSTTATNTMLLGFYGQSNNSGATAETAGAGFTMIDSATNNGGAFSCDAGAQYQIVSASQSGITVAFASSVGGPNGIVADAIQQAAGGGGGGGGSRPLVVTDGTFGGLITTGSGGLAVARTLIDLLAERVRVFFGKVRHVLLMGA